MSPRREQAVYKTRPPLPLVKESRSNIYRENNFRGGRVLPWVTEVCCGFVTSQGWKELGCEEFELEAKLCNGIGDWIE
ncbi:hypothetical protein CEXT_558151 [Caerostris extrusa]|uniref:Uncharacterized protein n=1 Tax=Caerostris extrusa TaxID=172846 RepID=A0AAV4WD01_CAEEX|nr:hypothetical protein CEXT_558151 [Caerostris extrusa]